MGAVSASAPGAPDDPAPLGGGGEEGGRSGELAGRSPGVASAGFAPIVEAGDAVAVRVSAEAGRGDSAGTAEVGSRPLPLSGGAIARNGSDDTSTEGSTFSSGSASLRSVSYTHLTLPTNREV